MTEPAQLPPSAPGRRDAWPALLILAATLAVYIPVMRGGYTWDDGLLLTANPLIKASDGLRRIWFSTESWEYLPLTYTMHWFEWRLLGPGAAGHHVVNILLHALSALLLWRVLLRLRVPGAWLAGLLFALHPVAAGSVAWVAERKNVLCMVLTLLALLAFLRFDDRPQRRWYLASLALFLLALLAKTSVVMLPFVLLLCLLWKRGAVTRRDILLSLPYFALSFVMGLVTIWFQWHQAMGGEVDRPLSVAARIAASGWIVWFYLCKLVLPIGLCAIYPRWQIDPTAPLAFVPLLLLIAALACLWHYRRGWARGPLFAFACFLVVLLPVLGFLTMSYARFSLVADHLQYPAMIAILALIAALLARAVELPGPRGHVALAVTVLCLLGLAGLTARRAWVYADDLRLWQDNLRHNPDSPAVWTHLGSARLNLGDTADAVRCFDRAIELRPDWAEAWMNRSVAHGRSGKLDLALADADRAVALRPLNAQTYNTRGALYARTHHLAEALRDFDKAIALAPGYADAWRNRGVARMESDPARLDDALRDFDRAVALTPATFDAVAARASAFAAARRWPEAYADYDRAAALKPGDPALWYSCALAATFSDRPDDALRCLDTVIALKPDHADALALRGAINARFGRLDLALPDYNKVLSLRPDDQRTLANRAAAFCELKQFDKARADIEAIRKLGGKPRPDLAERVERGASVVPEAVAPSGARP